VTRFLPIPAMALSLVTVSAGAQQVVLVPSGQPVTLDEVLLDENPGELWVRFRFIAPKIGKNVGKIGYDVTAVDMDHLCETLALPYIDQYGLEPARVVISMSDRAMIFGAADPTATQYFEAYRTESARCIWEEF